MKISLIILLSTLAIFRQDSIENGLGLPHIDVIAAESSVSLATIDFKDQSRRMQISDSRIGGIATAIKAFYFEECDGDPLETYYSMKEAYLSTIQINSNSNLTLYWVILRRPMGYVNSKILFYDEIKKTYLDYKHDFNIHALYDESDRELQPSNLKEHFSINGPEIECSDFNGNGIVDFKFTRLQHNGTSNGLEEMVIEIKGNEIDTLKYELDWMEP